MTSSCNLIDSIKPDGNIGGTQSVMGEVGNKFSLGSTSGVSGFNAEVKSLENGISSITATVTITDPLVLEMAKSVPEFTWNGNTLSVTKKYRITDQGIQNVYDEGNFTLVKYDDNVGDEYSIKIDGKTIKRKVESKSTVDDYAWGFMDIKVMKVGETGRPVAGVNKIEYILNHKFGIVGFKVYFEDGSEKEVRFFSQN
ncbi:hypothetical protein EGI22_11130 [Lacihabitans sp. LS3-19]|nr:hypothetical protein [Lacihabitans sp. LS3-19]